MDIKQKRAMKAQQRREAKKLRQPHGRIIHERITITPNGKAPTADEFFDAMRLLSQRVCGGMD